MRISMAVLMSAALLLTGCTVAELSVSNKRFPPVYVDYNETHQVKRDIRISLFRFSNYTDTPQAGLRAASLVEGELIARGYRVKSHLNRPVTGVKKARKRAKKDKSDYFLMGGVSEWRYKNGIDSEPAVSLKMVLYKTKSGKPVWSGTGSDSDWGNGSIGVTAQALIGALLEESN